AKGRVQLLGYDLPQGGPNVIRSRAQERIKLGDTIVLHLIGPEKIRHSTLPIGVRAVLKEGCDRRCGHVATHYSLVVEPERRRTDSARDHAQWCVIEGEIVRAALRIRHYVCRRANPSTGAASSLSVIGWCRWDVPHENRFQLTQVNTQLECRG